MYFIFVLVLGNGKCKQQSYWIYILSMPIIINKYTSVKKKYVVYTYIKTKWKNPNLTSLLLLNLKKNPVTCRIWSRSVLWPAGGSGFWEWEFKRTSLNMKVMINYYCQK